MLNRRPREVFPKHQPSSPQKKYEDTLARLAKFLEQSKTPATR